MKKLILLSILFFAYSISVWSQFTTTTVPNAVFLTDKTKVLGIGLTNTSLPVVDNSAMLQVHATSSNIPARFFPFNGDNTREIRVASPYGNPGLIFKNGTSVMMDIRGTSNSLDIVANGQPSTNGVRFINNGNLVVTKNIGIGTDTPKNRLEISNTVGSSGLRLSGLANSPSSKALGVNTTGDVILVDNPTYFSGDGIALSPVGINSFKIDNSFWQTNGSGIKNGNTVNDVEINGIGSSTTLNINPTIISAAIGINSNGYNVGVQGNGATGLLGISTKTYFPFEATPLMP